MTLPPPNPYPAQQPSASNQAIMALVLGILGIFCSCGPLSIIAWILGTQELKAIAQGRSPAAGEGISKAAQILGILGTLIMVAFLIWLLFMGGLALVSVFFSGLGN
jgi:hypothetical protein